MKTKTIKLYQSGQCIAKYKECSDIRIADLGILHFKCEHAFYMTNLSFLITDE